MYNVAVLMSTYNGEKYIVEQIDSILSQEDVNVYLYIRDDNSTDNTLSIIQKYENEYENVVVFPGDNIGVGNSFMQLLYSVEENYDYYAFSDQDDVWLPRKIIEAINKIEDCEIPTLYVSNQILVDGNLKTMRLRYDTVPDVSYMQIICMNKVAGCTMVWNEKLNGMLTDENRRPSEMLLRNRIHDVWVAMVASVVGRIIYDNEGYILYRQHENNVVGVRKTNIFSQWIKKLKSSEERNGRSLLSKEIIDNFTDDIREDQARRNLELFGFYRDNLKNKYKLMTYKGILDFSKEKRFMFMIKVLFNLF